MSVEAPIRPSDKKQSKDKNNAPGIQSLSEGELDALLERIRDAKEHSLALSVADYDVLLNAILTLANMQERLSQNALTQSRMKKLLGMVNSSEKLKSLRPQDASDAKPSAKKGRANKTPRKARPHTPKIKPTVEHHKLSELTKGDNCPECTTGKVYKYTPASLLRITGHSPYSAEKHVIEQLRCDACGEVYSATLPDSVKADGRVDQQYGYSARAMMAINKYFGGSPFHRQESLQNLFGAPVASSTQWDQCEKVANDLHLVFKHLKNQSANAHTFYLDDTTNRILNKVAIEKTRNGKTQWRSGVYTSACLALLNGKSIATGPPEEDKDITRRLVLFQSNIGHAGEWLDEILQTRDTTLPLPLLMSDALSSNHVTAVPFDKALCNAHARRGFAELIETHPDEAQFALETYEHAWVNNNHCRDNHDSAEQRQRYHAEHSLPHMQALKQWCEEQTSEAGQVEPNSNLGKAMQYYIRHFDGLSAFCRLPGAPLDNNEIERLIKLIVRGRRNSLFFKNQTGASVSDVITSILATCQENEVNAFDYLQSIQRNQLQVKASPEKWLPWNYPQDK